MRRSTREHCSTVHRRGTCLTGKGSSPSPHLLFLKSSLGKGEGVIKEETKIENTRLPTCLQTHRHAQLGEVKGEDALLVLVAVAPVTVKPVGGAIELWLGCRSLGMPL